MRVLDSAQMSAFDDFLIETVGMPVPVLMENAASGVVGAIDAAYPDVSRIAVLAGPGHNGADALAVARLWLARGGRARVAVACERSRISEGAEQQLEILERIAARVGGLEIEIGGAPGDQRDFLGEFLLEAQSPAVLVDGLFGTGLDRALSGDYAELVSLLAQLRAPKVAIDLPSGLSGSRAELLGPCLPADLTVTFVAPRVAHVLSPTDVVCGQVDRVDLGVPGALLEIFLENREQTGGGLFLDLARELAPLLERRSPESHKGSYGHVLVVGGSTGKSGAVLLATRAALRAGAGLVTAAVPASLVVDLEVGSAESMTLALAEGQPGHVGTGGLRQLLSALEGKSVVVLGPGLGQGEDAARLVRDAVCQVELPLVLDADGLNVLEGDLEQLQLRPAPTILTPHPGEMGRLLGVSVSEVQADRVAACRRAARLSGCVVILKGHQTLVATPDGDAFLHRVGNPGMATGGTGDALAGLCGGLLAQRSRSAEGEYDRVETARAARLAVHLHGMAGDLACAEKGEQSLLAGDLVEQLPRAFEQLRLTGRPEGGSRATVIVRRLDDEPG